MLFLKQIPQKPTLLLWWGCRDYVMKSLTSSLSLSLSLSLGSLHHVREPYLALVDKQICTHMHARTHTLTHESNRKCKHWQLGDPGLSNVRQRREKELCNMLTLDEIVKINWCGDPQPRTERAFGHNQCESERRKCCYRRYCHCFNFQLRVLSPFFYLTRVGYITSGAGCHRPNVFSTECAVRDATRGLWFKRKY